MTVHLGMPVGRGKHGPKEMLGQMSLLGLSGGRLPALTG